MGNMPKTNEATSPRPHFLLLGLCVYKARYEVVATLFETFFVYRYHLRESSSSNSCF